MHRNDSAPLLTSHVLNLSLGHTVGIYFIGYIITVIASLHLMCMLSGRLDDSDLIHLDKIICFSISSDKSTLSELSVCDLRE